MSEEIEDQDRLSNNCADCGTSLTEENRSGWYQLTEYDIQIEMCNDCAKEQASAPSLPKAADL